MQKAAAGEDPHVGAHAIRVAKGFVPLQNLWYTRLILDHLIVHNLQEWASPGYLRRMEERSRRNFGQGFWWKPGGLDAEMRAPNVGALAGEGVR
jgi:hypothetical protein